MTKRSPNFPDRLFCSGRIFLPWNPAGGHGGPGESQVDIDVLEDLHPFTLSAVTLSPFHLVTLHPFILSPCHPSPLHLGTFSPFHVSFFHPFTLSPRHLFTLSPFHPFTLSPFHPFTLSPLHPSTPPPWSFHVFVPCTPGNIALAMIIDGRFFHCITFQSFNLSPFHLFILFLFFFCFSSPG